MPAGKPIRELRRKAANFIIDRIKHPSAEQESITVAQAAIALDISRQAVYDILKRRYCPSLSLIHRACQVWDLKFDFRGMLIEKSIFSEKQQGEGPLTHTASSDAQLSLNLQEAIQKIDYRNFEVIEAKPVGKTVEITLRLTIPA